MSASGFLDELDECLAKIAQRSLFELAQELAIEGEELIDDIGE